LDHAISEQMYFMVHGGVGSGNVFGFIIRNVSATSLSVYLYANIYNEASKTMGVLYTGAVVSVRPDTSNFVVFTVDATSGITARGYVNGVLISNQNFSSYSFVSRSSSLFELTVYPLTEARAYVHDSFVFGRVLSASQVLALYGDNYPVDVKEFTENEYGTTEVGKLVHYWKMDGNGEDLGTAGVSLVVSNSNDDVLYVPHSI